VRAARSVPGGARVVAGVHNVGRHVPWHGCSCVQRPLRFELLCKVLALHCAAVNERGMPGRGNVVGLGSWWISMGFIQPFLLCLWPGFATNIPALMTS